MIKCLFCAEEIQEEAIKCRFCHEFLDGSRPPKLKWYFTTTVVVIALLSVGPFALPLIWWHPRYNKGVKAILTVVTIGLTIWGYFIAKDIYLNLMKQIKDLGLYQT